MSFFSFSAAIILIRYLQKRLLNTTIYVKWSNLLLIALWSTIILFVASFALKSGWAEELLGGAALGAIVFYIHNEPDFIPFRPYAYSHIPLIALSLLYGFYQLIFKNKPYFEDSNTYFELAILGAFIWVFARSASSRKQQKQLEVAAVQTAQLEKLVAERTAELTRQKNELQATVAELKTTQAQLIQSEKLASLGELTAGIAHEIQNPLNFVNNFADVSRELLDELEEELSKGDTDEVIAIAGDIKQNLEKISHHGRRADGIVKGMLQHSRASSTTKEPTDINKLADEYFRLAYHGLRAKDKSFNSELISHFDETLPSVNIVPQDIGRVLLNLFNNAFYAVHQKRKTASADYKPMVEVSTKRGTNQVIIKVKDNGTGIPEDIKDKIMQPFFTTKPTGEGTGLGLSLSYDIIVKAHAGRLDINTVEGEYTEFVIILPLQ